MVGNARAEAEAEARVRVGDDIEVEVEVESKDIHNTVIVRVVESAASAHSVAREVTTETMISSDDDIGGRVLEIENRVEVASERTADDDDYGQLNKYI
mmetsp:Transcript_7609/g.27861  ORF Transcript_7609/g.27861 Transcript_7609/m.27861 type:complete len:98 (-) Transcript_7609:593-886(-)